MYPIPGHKSKVQVKPLDLATIQPGKYVTVLGPVIKIPPNLLSEELQDALTEASNEDTPATFGYTADPGIFKLQGQPLRVESVAWPLVLCSMRNPLGEILTVITLDSRRVELVPLPPHYLKKVRSLFKEVRSRKLNGASSLRALIRRNGEEHTLEGDEARNFMKSLFSFLPGETNPGTGPLTDEDPNEESGDDPEPSAPITE